MVDRLIRHRLALFGQPVNHSRSPEIHQGFAQQFQLNINYELIDVDAADFPTQLHAFMRRGQGANITVPHKELAFETLDHHTDLAKAAGAVNTVYWQDSNLVGDNTDGAGLVMDLAQKQIRVDGSTILILGAGGATKGIIPSLLKAGVDHIDIQNRSVDKAIQLASQFDRCHHAKDATASNYDLIIHATSMGHHGLTPALQNQWFGQHTTAYDLSYGEAAQPFMTEAKARGAKQTHDGLGMLYGQAAVTFERWFGKIPTLP